MAASANPLNQPNTAVSAETVEIGWGVALQGLRRRWARGTPAPPAGAGERPRSQAVEAQYASIIYRGCASVVSHVVASALLTYILIVSLSDLEAQSGGREVSIIF